MKVIIARFNIKNKQIKNVIFLGFLGLSALNIESIASIL